jgi:hypothetical protein
MNAIAFTRGSALLRASRRMAACTCGHPSRLAEDGEHLRMTIYLVVSEACRVG